MRSSPEEGCRRFERVLVTGGAGFTGLHLLERVRGGGAAAFCFDRAPCAAPGVESVPGDICRREDVDRAVAAARPDCVVHLASVFDGPDPRLVYEVNVGGTLNLLESLRAARLARAPIVVIVCSSAQYGMPRDAEAALAEEASFRPVSHYGASKAAQDLMGLQYHLRGELTVMRARPFNLIGPGQPARLLCGSLVEQLVGIERGRRPPVLHVGDLSPRRDYVDVRDAAEAYWRIATRGAAGEAYNVCCGQAWSVREVLEILLGLVATRVEVRQQEARRRAIDVPVQVGDGGKLRAATGWQPAIALPQTLRDMLEWERRRPEPGR